MQIDIPWNALVILVGGSASGKSTLASLISERANMDEAWISSDYCREATCGEVTEQGFNHAAFSLYHTWIEARLSCGQLTIADATNLLPDSRKRYFEMKEKFGMPLIAIVLDTPLDVAKELNKKRERNVPEKVLEKHSRQFAQARRQVEREPFDRVYNLPWDEVLGGVDFTFTLPDVIEGPGFDFIGDIHGCVGEFDSLVTKLGYDGEFIHPEGRKLVLLGDLTDRGPENFAALVLGRELVRDGHYWVRGNHDEKLAKALLGAPVRRAHGLQLTMAELEADCPQAQREAYGEFINTLPRKLAFRSPGQKDILATHGGIPARLIGSKSKVSDNACIFGLVKGFEADGKPIRDHNWKDDWPHHFYQVHGHEKVDEVEYYNGVYNVDTAAVFGGKLSALRYPEMEIVQVKSSYNYDVQG